VVGEGIGGRKRGGREEPKEESATDAYLWTRAEKNGERGWERNGVQKGEVRICSTGGVRWGNTSKMESKKERAIHVRRRFDKKSTPTRNAKKKIPKNEPGQRPKWPSSTSERQKPPSRKQTKDRKRDL